MANQTNEVLGKIKELRNLSNETEINLEKSGLSITSIAKEQLFNYNIKNIISAVEGILRNEPAERHTIRLVKEIPDAYNNITKIKETPPGKANTTHLDKVKQLISYLEKAYPRL